MKKIFTLVFLGFAIAGFGQKKYSEVEDVINETVNSFTNDSEEVQFLKIVKANFDKAGKLTDDDFKKDNVGIAFVISKGEEKPMIVPAKFSYDNEKVNISAVNAKDEDMQDYVQKYLHKIETIGSTSVSKNDARYV